MTIRLRVIGDELVVEGQRVGGLFEVGTQPTLLQDLRDTLDGLPLDTFNQDGGAAAIDAAVEATEEQEFKRKRSLIWALKRLRFYRLCVRGANDQNDKLRKQKAEAENLCVQARRWAEETTATLSMQLQRALKERDEARAFAERLLIAPPPQDPAGTRYFYHPESDSKFKTFDGSRPQDPLVEELNAQEFYKPCGAF